MVCRLTVLLSALTVQGNSVTVGSGKSGYSAIDTGTTLIGGPQDVIAEIYANIPDSAPGTGNYEGYYTYRESRPLPIQMSIHNKMNFLACNTAVNVTMSFGGRSWGISSTDFEMTRVSGNQCVGSFFVLGSTSPAWIIGDTFLVSRCSSSRKDASCAHLIHSEKRLLRVQI